jgi:hypothetical protein
MEIRLLKPAHRFIKRADKGFKEKIKMLKIPILVHL